MTMITRQFFSDRAGLLRRFSSSTSRVLTIGDTMKRTRTFTEEDVRVYGEISHDKNPVHFDPEAARNAGFEERLVHGMLVASLLPRILAHHFPGAVYASQSLHFKLPVYIGEEIGGEVEVISLRAIKNRYLAKFKTRCFKNGTIIAVDGEAVAVLPSLAVAQAQDLTS